MKHISCLERPHTIRDWGHILAVFVDLLVRGMPLVFPQRPRLSWVVSGREELGALSLIVVLLDRLEGLLVALEI